MNRSRIFARRRIRGAAEKGPLADWFYTQGQEPSVTEHAGRFFEEVRTAGRADTPDLLTVLVADPRFEHLGWESLRGMLALASAGRPAPLASEHELLQARGGPDRLITFSKWRNLLRRTAVRAGGKFGSATEGCRTC